MFSDVRFTESAPLARLRNGLPGRGRRSAGPSRSARRRRRRAPRRGRQSVASAVRHRHRRAGRSGEHGGGRLGPVEAGQPEVHQDDGRVEALRGRGGLAAVRDGADDLEARPGRRAAARASSGTRRCPRRAAPGPPSLTPPRGATGSAAGPRRGSRSRRSGWRTPISLTSVSSCGSSAPVSRVRISRPPSRRRSATAPATESKLSPAGDGGAVGEPEPRALPHLDPVERRRRARRS